MTRKHQKKKSKHPKPVELPQPKPHGVLPKSHFSHHSSVNQNKNSLFQPSRRSSVITSQGRYAILTRNSGLNDLSRNSLKKLTALLKMDSAQFIDQPRRDWLMDQKSAVNSLHRSLQRPSSLVARAAIRGGTYQAPFCPGVANLCRWHAGLDPRMIRNLARLLVKECTSRAHFIRDTREKRAHDPEVLRWLTRMDTMAALWMSEEDLEKRLGYKLRRAIIPQRAECEACICAAVGGSPDMLADLKAGILAREESHSSKRRRPRLLRIVEIWIESYDEAVRSSIHRAASILSPLLANATTSAKQLLGAHHASDCDSVSECQNKRPAHGDRHEHRNGRENHLSRDHAPVPTNRRASTFDVDMSDDRNERFANMEHPERPTRLENPLSSTYIPRTTNPRADDFNVDMNDETAYVEYVQHAGDSWPKVMLPDDQIPKAPRSARRGLPSACPPGMSVFTAPSAAPLPLHFGKDPSPSVSAVVMEVNQDEEADKVSSWVTNTVHSRAPSFTFPRPTRYTKYMNKQFPGLSSPEKKQQQQHPGKRLSPTSIRRRPVPPPSSVYSSSPGGVRTPTVVTEAMPYAAGGHMRDHIDHNPKHLHWETLKKLEWGIPLAEWEAQQANSAGWI